MLKFPYISRQLETPLSMPRLSGRAEIILGPRQVGKTTLLNNLVQGMRHLVLTGEDDEDLAVLADPRSYLKLLDEFDCIIIDEAQFVPGIGRVIKRMVDSGKAENRIFVTGSSSLELAGGMKVVDKCFAFQAGREIRILVKPEEVKDEDMVLLARELSVKIENEMSYPGTIKVHVVRETRAVDYAK